MRHLMLAALIAGGAALPATAATRAFPVGGFDRVASGVPFDVHVHTGKMPSVRANGPKDVLDRLRVQVRGGELTIGSAPGNWFSGGHGLGGKQKVVIDVTVPMVTAARLSGPGNMDVDNVRTRTFAGSLSGPGKLRIGRIEANQVTLDVSGPGGVSVAGHSRTARLTGSGPGNVQAAGLAAADVTVALSGPGTIDASASHTANVRLSGPGTVRIAGHPRCTVSKSGPGKVICG